MAEELALAVRSGLPDPLRVLVEKHPRESWEGHANFTMLTRFWLDRHLGFRHVQGLLLAETRAFLDHQREPEGFARGLARLAGGYLDDLHGHHMVEDRHYFPLLKTLDARLESGFELLDADHLALEEQIRALADAANQVLAAVRHRRPADAAAGGLVSRLDTMGRLIDRHLTDEEELVVPVILDHPVAGLG